MIARSALVAALLAATPALAQAAPVHRVGAVTWHAARYAGKVVTVRGYLLARKTGYILFSDEPDGGISAHDLPVIGAGIGSVKAKTEYRLTGRFVKGGLKASNGNPYHLELSAAPESATGSGG